MKVAVGTLFNKTTPAPLLEKKGKNTVPIKREGKLP